jgi:hypothetical protein
MSYFIGMLVSALVIVGVASMIIKRFWKRPMLASLAAGLLAAILYYFGSDGGIGVQYVVAGMIWGGIWSWRAKKSSTKAPDAPPPAAV